EPRPQRQLGEGQRDVAVEGGAVPGEERVLADTDPHAEVAGGPAVQAVVPGAAAAHGHPVVDAGWYPGRPEMLCLRAALSTTVTTRAGVDLTLAGALRARPRHLDRAQPRCHLALPPARVAPDRAAAGLDAESAAPRAHRQLG